MTDADTKIREDRLRGAADRQNLTLRKNRQRDHYALGYGTYALLIGDPGLYDPGYVAPGASYLTLDQVERYLARDVDFTSDVEAEEYLARDDQ